MEGNAATGLNGLSNEIIKKAFDKVKVEDIPKEWELKLLTIDLQDDAILFMKEFFVPYEPLVRLFDVQWDVDAEHYWNVVFDQGISLALKNKVTNEIIAIRGIEIVSKSDTIDTDNVSDKRLRNLLNYLNFCDDRARFFEHYNTEKAVHLSGLAVAESYRRRGIATLILTKAVEFIENLGLDCVYIKGEASSDYSKKIYEKLNFEALFEQFYLDYEFDGKRVFKEIGEHESNKIYGKRITRTRTSEQIPLS